MDKRIKYASRSCTAAFTAAFAAALAMTLSGCATTPFLDENFGNSVRAARAAQVINPAAARNPNPVSGLDGRAAQAAQARYMNSFVAPTSQESILGQGDAK